MMAASARNARKHVVPAHVGARTVNIWRGHGGQDNN
jgi:hypothetical protein